MNQPYRGLGEWWAAQRRVAEAEAEGKSTKAACPTHHTDTSEGTWDAGANMRRLPSPMSVGVAKREFALYDGEQVQDGKIVKAACSLPHHDVSTDGSPGAANLAGVRNALARLSQVQGYSDADKAAAKAHLQAHLDDQPGNASMDTGKITRRESAMTLERLVVPIEWKAADVGDGVLEGYASTFGNVDLGGDVIVKGAFKKTIANIKANGIPLLADHMPTVNSVLGTIFDAKEDDYGLLVRAQMSAAQSAQDARMKMIEGHVNKMSIGYETMNADMEDRNGEPVRLLKEIKLWEASVVVFPMNPQAVISRVKSIMEMNDCTALLPTGAYDQMVAAAKSANTITVSAGSMIAGTLTPDSPADEAGGTGDEPVEEKAVPAAVPADEAEKKADEADKGTPQGWDRWRSEAVLSGHDPSEVADPVRRTRLDELLRLEEDSYIYRSLDPAARAELDRQLRDTVNEVNNTRRRYTHPSVEEE